MKPKVSIFWHRRDLRLEDNTGLFHALRSGEPILPLFIFDRHILDDLEDKQDARVTFIHANITALHRQLAQLGSSLLIRYGKPEEIWPQLLADFDIQSVHTTRDDEPSAIARDPRIAAMLSTAAIPFHHYKDHVIFDKEEVRKDDGDPYVVFTPYSRKWRRLLLSRMIRQQDENGQETEISRYLQSYPTEDFFQHFFRTEPLPVPALETLGFEASSIEIPDRTVSRGLIRHYDQTRDIPSIRGTSRLGIHFRFGTISIREKARKAFQLNDTFLNELIWRDFYAQILAHFPHVADRAFRPRYDQIQWRNDEEDFRRWCEGKTGYPIVDAGMRELNETGFMHNRVRMITASFLTKHLLIDWRWGEAYFAGKLLDYELASNNGGWQWAAGSGTDAAPYFRIFNPTSQQKKFDKDFHYIRRWVPEFGTPAYPQPMVDHKFARERCLQTYKEALDRD